MAQVGWHKKGGLGCKMVVLNGYLILPSVDILFKVCDSQLVDICLKLICTGLAIKFDNNVIGNLCRMLLLTFLLDFYFLLFYEQALLMKS